MALREKPQNWLSRITKRGGSGAATQDETAKSAHERRREQIRRAQHTHRERKELYIKNLEAEVVILREKDATHEQALLALKHRISVLNQILLVNGISVPSEFSNIDIPQAIITVQIQPDGIQNVRATMPTFANTQSPSRTQIESMPAMTTPTNSQISDPQEIDNNIKFAHGTQVLAQPTQAAAEPRSQGHPYHLEEAQVAVDFVLDLERPCLTHHGPDLHDGEFNGHRFMVQTPIMTHENTPRHILDTEPGGQLPNDATWAVPTVQVERLLNLSSCLNLEGELTPIQAWQKLKQHPGFATLSQQRLQQLKAVLLPGMQCYGFGAVIDEQYFDLQIEKHLTANAAI